MEPSPNQMVPLYQAGLVVSALLLAIGVLFGLLIKSYEARILDTKVLTEAFSKVTTAAAQLVQVADIIQKRWGR